MTDTTKNNRLNIMAGIIAEPIKAMAKAGIAYGKKKELMIAALDTLRDKHEINLIWSDFISPFDNGGVKLKKVQNSTSSPEQWTLIKACFAMAMNQTEQGLVTFDLKAYQKELGLTLAATKGETAKAKSYRSKARNKTAANQKLNSQITDFKNLIKPTKESDDTLQDKLVKRSDSFIKVFSDDAYKSLVGNNKTVWLSDYTKLMAKIGIVVK